MRTFELHRHEDITGISGTGIVAEGVEFTDGTVVVRWLPAGTARPDHVKPTTVVHDDIDSVVGLHGHNGSTRVVWDDERGKKALTQAAIDALSEPNPHGVNYRHGRKS